VHRCRAVMRRADSLRERLAAGYFQIRLFSDEKVCFVQEEVSWHLEIVAVSIVS
jgi:hypothetical protein